MAQDSLYYHTAFNSSGSVLKDKLHQLIKNHREYPYTASSTDVWDILKLTDKDTVNPDNVILIYSAKSVDAAQEYNSGSGWTREHVWAKSRGDFGTDPGAGTDVHHLRACDGSVNSSRNNRNFDNCITCVNVDDEGAATGSLRDANLWTFEPRDDVKGDVARMIFYMAVRYEGEGSEPDLELVNTLLSKTDQAPNHSVLTTLLEWNKIDPVSAWEQNRNEIIYTQFQLNRNPFIDYPEIAEYIWGDSINAVWMAHPLSTITNNTTSSIEAYPNPTSGTVILNGEIEEVKIFNSVGVPIRLSFLSKNSIDFSSVPNGIYFMHIVQPNHQTQVIKLVKK
jgi:endonuclease I